MSGVAITSFGAWTSGGASVRTAPFAGSGLSLAPWSEAPPLTAFHPRARRPHPVARAAAQLARAVLGARSGAPLEPSRVAMIVGAPSASAAADLDFLFGLRQRGPAFGSPSTFVYTLPSAPLGEISIALGLTGGFLTVSAGAASALSALARSARWVASGGARACLCGAIEVWSPESSPRPEAGADSIAFVLLEPQSGSEGGGPILLDVRTGFRPEGGGAPASSSNGPLLELQAALAGGLGPGRRTLSAQSREGFWAEVEFEGR